jgi:hypothetical protein
VDGAKVACNITTARIKGQESFVVHVVPGSNERVSLRGRPRDIIV